MMQRANIEVWTSPLLQGTLSAALFFPFPLCTSVDSLTPTAEHALPPHIIKDPNFNPPFTGYKFTHQPQSLLQQFAKQGCVAISILVLLAIILFLCMILKRLNF